MIQKYTHSNFMITIMCMLPEMPRLPVKVIKINRKAMNRNWSNQKANPTLKTKTGNK